MWLNYMKIAFRNLVKYKLYTVINIAGLAIGMASFLLIGLYIVDETSFDRYHENAEDIYRLVNVYDFEGVGEVSASSPFPVAWTLKNDYPGIIKNITRVFDRQQSRTLIEHGEHTFNERRFFFADSTFFEIFNYKFLAGNPLTAIDEINSVVITESTAQKYFGNDNPMGKTFRFEKALDLKVTGVIKDVPSNSHFKFDFMASLSTVKQIYGGQLPNTWVWNPCWTYLLLEKGTAEKLESSLDVFVQKYFYDAEKENISLYLQPLVDIHLKSKLDYEIEPNSNISYIRILAAIALFLLIIAIINYLNLATATSAERANEIGMKKVFGVNRSQLVYQFLFESVLLAFFALLVALVIIELALPSLNAFSIKNLTLSTLLVPKYAMATASIVIITGLFAGIYPAVFLSSFNPITILKGKLAEGTRSGLARKILVIIQFTISIVLIIITLSIFNQVSYLKNANTGFKKDNIVFLPVSNTNIAKSFESFKQELLLNPGIESVTTVDDILGAAHTTHEFRPEDLEDEKWHFYPALVVGYDFLETFGIELVAGRGYNRKNKTDPEKGILINEAMVKHQGWESNEAALGKKFRSLKGKEKVIGVFKNFNATSLHEPAGPFVLNMKEESWEIMWFLKYVAIRINPENKQQILEFIEDEWNRLEEGRPFEYTFLDEELAQLYHDEEVLGKLSLILTAIIIFIAVLGLWGLATFMTEQRTKEIGIRKVYGADELSIIKLLSVEFAKLVAVAIIIAWPLSFWLIDEWLDYFAYQVNISFMNFLVGGIAAFIIAMMITVSRAFIASRRDPVHTLKYE
jgi:putative ABC transport system permease protein